MAYPPPQESAMSRNGLPIVTCPTIFAVEASGPQVAYRPVELTQLSVAVDIHIATAFATVEYSCRVPAGVKKTPGLFLLPKHRDGVVTECKIDNKTKNKTYITTVMPRSEVERMAKRGKQDGDQPSASPTDPELFNLDLPQMNSGDELFLTVTWFWPMDFRAGTYQTTVPTMFSQPMVGGRSLSDIASIRVNINTGFPVPVRWQCASHSLSIQNNYEGKVELVASRASNSALSISYQCPNQGDIGASVNVQVAAPDDPDPRGTFALNLAPPQGAQSFPRSVVFVIDKSGSMTGDPWQSARTGITEALGTLSSVDEFTVIAYDHGQYPWNASLQPATRSNVNDAINFVGQISPSGMTDIMTPLHLAFQTLYPPSGEGRARGIPYIFLLTDGAVDNEKDIVRWALGLSSLTQNMGVPLPRIHTFGVGIFCNHYFLKQLATVSRGLSDVALKPFQISQQIKDMMLAAEKPVLTDIVLEVSGLKEVEIYPFPIPDLYSGRPLIVSGKFMGSWPGSVRVVGMLADGRQWSKEVLTFMEASVPLNKVFAKQRIDLMAAKAWMDDDRKLKEKVVDLSVRENIPCVHTMVVGFEADPGKVRQWEKEKRIKGGRMSGGTIAALAVGGAVGVAAVSVAVLAFGSVAATSAGTLAGEGMAILGTMGGDLGNILGSVGQGCSGCCGDIGNCCGDVFNGCDIGGACGAVGDACGNIGDCCGNACGDVGNLCGDMGGMCGDVCSMCGNLLGGICDALGGLNC